MAVTESGLLFRRNKAERYRRVHNEQAFQLHLNEEQLSMFQQVKKIHEDVVKDYSPRGFWNRSRLPLKEIRSRLASIL